MTKFPEFFNDDAGAVTVDWITLTAGILLLGIMIIYAIYNYGLPTLVPNINEALAGEPANVALGTINIE